MTVPGANPPVSPTGSLFERTITRLLMRPARVAGVQCLSNNFRLVEFEGEALRGCDWSPGDKVQVKLDAGLSTRTYTPIEWDRAAGAMRILAYCHGDGPGSDWARSVASGDVRMIMGPRGSLNLNGAVSSTILFGDETAFGLAKALCQTGAVPFCVFEVNALAESRAVLEQIGIASPTIIERRQDDAHLGEVTEAILNCFGAATRFVLCGKAQSVQHINRAFKAHGVETQRLRTKAYWSPGKVGLD